MKLSVIIPAYNEEARLGAMLEAYAGYFVPRYGDDVELIVVANGCRDRTPEIAKQWAERHAQIKVIVEPASIGKGGAIMLGMREARGEWIGFVDADLSTPPENFEDLVRQIRDAGLIVASRWIKGAQVSPRQPLKRRIASRVFNALVRWLFRLNIHDTQCGAKLMTRAVRDAVLPKLGITRWAFDVDLLFQVRRSGYRIIEHPTVWHDAPGSQLKVLRASVEMLLAIVRLRLLYSPLRWVVTLYDQTIGKIVHLPPEGFSGRASGGVLRHGSLLLAATLFGSFCNMLFHVVMGRALDPSEYGVLASMLGIILIAGTPMDALRTALTHFAARFAKEDRLGAVKHLMWKAFGWMVGPFLLIGLCGTLLGRPIAAFFQMYTPAPVVVTAWVLGFSFFMPVVLGALLGVQAFVWMSVAQHSWGVVRLLIGAVFVWALPRAAVWGITAQGAGVVATLILGVVGLYAVVKQPTEPLRTQDRVGTYFLQSLLALAGFAVLMNADVLLVKHFFNPHDAGLFARAGTIGRIMVFLTTPIAMAMFPKVASGGAVLPQDRVNLLHAVIYSAILLVAVASLVSFAPQLPIWFLYGERLSDASMITLVRAMTWAMAPLGLGWVLLNFEIAQHRFRFTWGLMACALGYLIGVSICHQHLWQIPAILAPAGALTMVFLLAEMARVLK